MAKYKLHGEPKRTTPGAVGDIYIDMNTGLEYRCTFAYHDPFFATLDCEWRPTGNTHRIGKNKSIEEPVNVVKEVVTEQVRESVKSEKPRYTNYSKHSKKNK